jgi:acetyltransferase-like isoleucine patch superfamily enzyme
MASSQKDAALVEYAKSFENVPWCDDYEKMISGMLYNCMAPELVNGRFRARRLMNKYNTHFPDDATPDSLNDDREAILKQMFGSLGKDAYIEPPLNIDYGCNVTIGERFYSNFNLVILDCGIVKIGNRVMFGPFVSIFAATHEVGVQSRRDNIEYARGVTIGDDCWIGGNTTIMPGVTVGKGCTIGAGSIVTKDIPDFSVAIGSPAKVIKKVDPVPDM